MVKRSTELKRLVEAAGETFMKVYHETMGREGGWAEDYIYGLADAWPDNLKEVRKTYDDLFKEWGLEVLKEKQAKAEKAREKRIRDKQLRATYEESKEKFEVACRNAGFKDVNDAYRSGDLLPETVQEAMKAYSDAWFAYSGADSISPKVNEEN